MSSGIGTMSKELVFGTLHHYNWVQIGGAIKHPEKGKILNIDKATSNEVGIEDAKLSIYPTDGYGDPELVRDIINRHKIDFILHYTDPRFWGWLYQMEHELRQHIPIFYYAIWDDLPYPMYNQTFYASCDLIMGISKQSHNIHKTVLNKYGVSVYDLSSKKRQRKNNQKMVTQVAYVPHGINENIFYPIDKDHKEWNELQKYKNQLTSNKKIEYIVFYNNRNIRRKMPGDIVLAFKTFCDTLSRKDADRCALVMHTNPVDQNGTDLPAVVEALCPEYNIIFSHNKLEPKFLNFLYNIADVTINLASNEGFGLGTAESLMTNTPIIVNVTGGLQDQCGFKKEDGTYLTIDDFSEEWSTNHDGKYTKYGEWVKPVFPANRALVGSVPTPYIFDDRCNFEDAAIRILEWYKVGKEERTRCGKLGREFVSDPKIGMTASEMSRRFIEFQDKTLNTWKPRTRFTVLDTNKYSPASRTLGITQTREIKENTLGY